MKPVVTLALLVLMPNVLAATVTQGVAVCATPLIMVTADFAGGAAGECRVVSDRRVVLSLSPEDEPVNPSPWYAFRVEGEGAVEIVIDYGDHRHRYRPKMSSDGETWRLLDPVVESDGSRITIPLALERDEPLLIAAQELMTSTFYDDWLDALLVKLPRGKRFEVGRSRGGREIWGLATNPGAENVVLLIGRQHPPEVTGAIALVAFVETLLEDEGDRCGFCAFHADTNLVVVPLVNPDGVDAGYWRQNFGGLDLNRDWRAFSQPETRALRDLIDRLAGDASVRAFFDFHSTFRNVFYTQDDGFSTAPRRFAGAWLGAAAALGSYSLENAKRRTTLSGTSKNYMHARFGVPAITYEVGDTTPREDIRRSARSLASAFVDVIHPYPSGVDLLIKGGHVIDGRGTPGHVANVAINGDRIVYIGDDEIAATRTIDARGLFVTPGFIDPHTHTDIDLLSPVSSVNLAYLHQGVTTVFVGNDGGGQRFIDAASTIDANRPGTNVGLFRGHGALRSEFVGLDDRAPTEEEAEAMVAALVEDMAAGALGLSSGLFYAPGSFATTEEVTRLATVVGEFDGVYDTHLRDEADYTIGLLSAVGEAIEIGRSSGANVHIAHIKALGPSVQGEAVEIIRLVEAARREGVRVTADQYPWLASGTRLSSALVPRWAHDGGREAMLARFDDVDLGERLRPDMLANLERRGGADRLLITGRSPYRGQNLAAIARELEVDALDAALAIVRAGDPAVASFMMTDADIEALMAKNWVMTGSDGSTGHPRKYGTYPRKYSEFVRKRGVLSTDAFVHRSSGLVAETFGLCDRGVLAKGKKADVAIWDPAAFASNATYENPTAYASGVRFVLVSGDFAIDEGEATGAQSGRVIRRTDCGVVRR